MSALCHERLTWPIDASRGGVAGWKAGREMASARITVERGVVGFGQDYACAHIIIPASVNLLPIQADFVTERVKGPYLYNYYYYVYQRPLHDIAMQGNKTQRRKGKRY